MKNKIDKFITDNYDKMLHITINKIAKYNVNVCPVEMLSEAYLYVCKNPPEVVSDIPKYMVHWMELELMFPKSVTNRRLRKVNRVITFENLLPEEYNQNIEEGIDVNNMLNTFLTKLDRVDQILFRVIVEKGITTHKGLSEYLDIPESTIRLYKVRILEKFRKHYEDQKRTPVQEIDNTDEERGENIRFRGIKDGRY